jgi:hypothetical protein
MFHLCRRNCRAKWWGLAIIYTGVGCLLSSKLVRAFGAACEQDRSQPPSNITCYPNQGLIGLCVTTSRATQPTSWRRDPERRTGSCNCVPVCSLSNSTTPKLCHQAWYLFQRLVTSKHCHTTHTFVLARPKLFIVNQRKWPWELLGDNERRWPHTSCYCMTSHEDHSNQHGT